MEITSRMMLKPAYSAAHPLAGEKVPLTVFDRAAADKFVSAVRVYPAPAPSNDALKEGLLRAVALYPHFAGRLAVDGEGRPFLHVNDEGVLVIEATMPTDLADVFPGAANVPDDLYPTPPEEKVGAALLQIKLNRYKCGGLVIGSSCHHHTADGHSMGTFYAVWSRAVREGKDFVAPSPFLDRTSTAVPRSTPAPVFDHGSIEFRREANRRTSSAVLPVDKNKIKSITVHFAAEFIAELKSRVGARCSTFQCLLAHVWKRITAARGLSPEVFTQVRVAVDCRGRAKPRVPMDFFGNMVLWAFPRLQVKDVLGLSYGGVVGAIRDAVARIDEEYIQSFVDFGTLAADEELVAATSTVDTVLCPDIEVASWLGLRLHQADFGTGPPSALLKPDMHKEGLIIFVPSPMAEGAVDVVVALPEDHVAAFTKICYSLDDTTIFPPSRM
ncbi:hypothetical protein ACQ4PT_002599 [Festuca glaucescens]